MSTRPASTYLHEWFFSPLRTHLEKAQNKAQAAQWINFIQALKQKGVKELEINDSKILEALATHPGSLSLTKDDVLNAFDSHRVSIRETVLPKNQWSLYALPGYDRYLETIYVLESERDYINYQLSQIRFELEELNFDLDALATNPERVYELDAQRKMLMSRLSFATDFQSHHYSDVADPEDPTQKIRNLLAHTRTSYRQGVFFVDELQSDWAQRYRRFENNENYPHAPFISNTEAWAGLILKRQLQRAAMDPHTQHFAWITAELRNGTRIGGNDGLNDFYTVILPKVMNKFLKGTDQKVKMLELPLVKGNDRKYAVPGIEITQSVREKMIQPAALYSLDVDTQVDYTPTTATARLMDQRHLLKHTTKAFQDAFLGAKEMFSGVFELRLVSHILNDTEQVPASGSFMGNVLNISLQGRDMLSSLDHELWHLAESALVDPMDVATIHEAFSPGRRLNTAVRQAMVADNANPNAVAQCDDPAEAAAFGFALWRQGKLAVDPKQNEPVGQTGIDRTVGRVFVRVEKAFHSLAHWMRRLIVKETKNEIEQNVVNSAFQKFGHALDQATLKAATRRLEQELQGNDAREHEHSLHADTTRTVAMRA
ncbi:hypothetical protein PuT2_11530 [Pusillimonas sp. T2]|uniref:hypothetical protein n=1 Tax=Pusillimonas sp. T2 TaxID=1548123 RepID=UPI000B9D0985|nr:hypothetical protein [Pusillimonas sp. T2]OXR48598.1 hypothetical protein PuT2_11530 [Pusillimonas sp. T2]